MYSSFLSILWINTPKVIGCKETQGKEDITWKVVEILCRLKGEQYLQKGTYS